MFFHVLKQDILQAVHDEEKNEMVRISEEKHQLSECLDIMSSEIANLRNSIACQDQQENPQRVFDDGAALEKMLDAIELGHNRAEQLESKIGNLQVRELHFANCNALSFPFHLCTTIVMQIDVAMYTHQTAVPIPSTSSVREKIARSQTECSPCAEKN